MGSPISPLIANLFMEEFEVIALSTAPTPCLWLRFVDDTLVIHKAEHSKQLLQHINSQDPNTQFTVEEPGPDGSIPFLDTKVTCRPNNTINTTVYRKPTHTDQYLQWDSNHCITAKHSVYSTLAHRAKVVSSDQTDLSKELDHIRRALQSCLFLTWALNRLQHILNPNTTTGTPAKQTFNKPTTSTPMSPPPTTSRGTFSWWSHTYRVWEKCSRKPATNKAYKYTSKGLTL